MSQNYPGEECGRRRTSCIGIRASPESRARGLVISIDVGVLARVLEVVVVLDAVGRASVGRVVRAAAAVGGVGPVMGSQYVEKR